MSFVIELPQSSDNDVDVCRGDDPGRGRDDKPTKFGVEETLVSMSPPPRKKKFLLLCAFMHIVL